LAHRGQPDLRGRLLRLHCLCRHCVSCCYLRVASFCSVSPKSWFDISWLDHLLFLPRTRRYCRSDRRTCE